MNKCNVYTNFELLSVKCTLHIISVIFTLVYPPCILYIDKVYTWGMYLTLITRAHSRKHRILLGRINSDTPPIVLNDFIKFFNVQFIYIYIITHNTLNVNTFVSILGRREV